jgi:quercetin dioxygenase-like cupin family protein
MSKSGTLFSHLAVAGIAAACASFATVAVLSGGSRDLIATAAKAQAPGQKVTDVVIQALPDIAREMRIRLTERDPGNGSTPHRHPGHHTFGYVVEGTYEVKINDGPVRQLKAGDSFYEPPGALHAISRNPSPDKPVKYLVIQVADPTKPATVQE